MLPASHGNQTPRYRICLTIPPGPLRVVDGGERPRFHVATVGKAHGPRMQPACDLRRCRKILVVKLDFIGDWVLTSPFLSNLRRNAPHAEITAVVLDRVFDLAVACPDVDRAISASRAEQRRVVFAADSIAALGGFRRDYLGGVFDLALVPRWDADFNGALQIASGSRARFVVGFSEHSASRRARFNRGEDRFYTHAVVDHRLIHEADRDLVLIEVLRGHIEPTAPHIHFSMADKRDVDDYLAGSALKHGRFLAVAPFGSKARTTLPSSRLAGTVRRLADALGLGVVVVGGPIDVGRANDFARKIGPRAVPAAGAFGTRQTAALLAMATAFIGMDSGPAHIAAAVGTPTAVLSCHPVGAAPGHAHAPDRFAPRGRRGDVLIIRPERPTAPCVDGCEAEKAHCILALTEAILWPKLSRFVQAALSAAVPRKPPRRTSVASTGRISPPPA
jgi:ADP-heptose:LPS heptosyltransferase